MTTRTMGTRLTPARQRLVDWLRKLRYGKIEDLRVVGGEPVLDPMPAHVKEVKFGSEDELPHRGDAGLVHNKKQWVELHELFDRLGTGVIATLEVKGGVPFRAHVATAAAK